MSKLLLLFLLLPSLVSVSALTVPSDVAAVAAFKYSIAASSINPWSCVASWNFTSDPCRPSVPTHFTCGITCSADSTRITAISLDPAGYSGTLAPAVSNLTLLTHLELSDNAFHGPIPESIFSSLASLQTLVLSSNAFSGSIPVSLSNLSNLQTLDLSRNSLTGSIPQFPASRLSNLASLDLSFNGLSGGLPNTLPSNLVVLALRGNFLSGVIKRSTLQPLRFLEVVELGVNRFQGKLEGWFFQLPSLQQVDLANNSLTLMEVWKAGAGAGDRLVAVDLSFNRIEGELPIEFAGFSSLAALSMSHNRLRGQIPWQYKNAKKGAALKRLFLDGNFLNGRVPNGMLVDGDMAGSLGDNCLESCPKSVALCSPVQKPDWVCKQVYGVGGGTRSSPSLNGV